ncbi:MAG: GWxTD domain-containing protein [candidate division WOR-3 bacterium]
MRGLTAFLLPFILTWAQEIAFDYSVFWVSDSLNFVECYYSLPYTSLPFKTKDDTSFSYLTLYLYLDGLLRDSLSRTLSVPKGIENFSYLSVVDGFGFFQKKGIYPLELVVFLGEREKKFRLFDTVLSFDFQKSPSLSSILFANYLGGDSLIGRFYRNGFWFTPNPARVFKRSREQNLAYAYLEVYNLTKNEPYEVNYRIKGNGGEWRIGGKIDTAHARNFVLPLSFSIRGLKEGNYTLKVSVTDRKTGGKAEREKEFTVQEEIEESLPFSLREKEEIFLLVARDEEKKNFQKLSPQDKEAYLQFYFQKVDYEEMKRRISYINEKFGKKGRKGERARIVLKYGIPDEIESHLFKENVRPHEHWYYRNLNYHFLFMYIRDVGEPVLLWSNVKEERNYPGWERFVDPEEYEELR